MCGCTSYALCDLHRPVPPKPKCLLCDEQSSWSLEIKGLFKQYLCDRHIEILAPAIKAEYYYGREQLDA